MLGVKCDQNMCNSFCPYNLKMFAGIILLNFIFHRKKIFLNFMMALPTFHLPQLPIAFFTFFIMTQLSPYSPKILY